MDLKDLETIFSWKILYFLPNRIFMINEDFKYSNDNENLYIYCCFEKKEWWYFVVPE